MDFPRCLSLTLRITCTKLNAVNLQSPPVVWFFYRSQLAIRLQSLSIVNVAISVIHETKLIYKLVIFYRVKKIIIKLYYFSQSRFACNEWQGSDTKLLIFDYLDRFGILGNHKYKVHKTTKRTLNTKCNVFLLHLYSLVTAII